MNLKEKLTYLVAQTSLTLQDDQLDKLVKYVELLHKWNSAYNLTSVRDPEDMLVKHIVDSIVVSPLLEGQYFIDVGTGPGLPGIPLAITRPECEFYLLDSLGKRVRFLREVKRALSLENIEPVQSRVESFVPEKLFDGVISRAFASLNDMIEGSKHLLSSSGQFYALKGLYPDKEIAALPNSVRVASFHSLVVPSLDAERHLICLNFASEVD